MSSALGELEICVLLAALRLDDEAYGVSIRDEIRDRTGRHLSRGAIYSAITRLESRGFLDSSLGEPTPVRGGRAKRFFSVTPDGLSAVRTSTNAVDRMREGLDTLLSGR
jgi:DNA-binding PadR family transcriptional regulator